MSFVISFVTYMKIFSNFANTSEILQGLRLSGNTVTPSSFPQVTRTGELLEAASKAIVALVRKTRVGKRCAEDWLLKGLEKHVLPLINLDKPLAEDLGLGECGWGKVTWGGR